MKDFFSLEVLRWYLLFMWLVIHVFIMKSLHSLYGIIYRHLALAALGGVSCHIMYLCIHVDALLTTFNTLLCAPNVGLSVF